MEARVFVFVGDERESSGRLELFRPILKTLVRSPRRLRD